MQAKEIKSSLDVFKSKAISFVIFGRSNAITQLESGFFDEKLGVGSEQYGAQVKKQIFNQSY